jgi:hypothetical protein
MTRTSRATGKWKVPGVPHKGWTCIDTEDLMEGNSETCEMCEVQDIRFAHVMEHKEYPDLLRCGCDCAGHMEGNLKAAEARKRGLIKAVRSRKRALKRLQSVSQRLQQQAPIVARAQKCSTALRMVAAGSVDDYERQFTDDMLSRLGRDYAFANRMTDGQRSFLLKLLRRHRAHQQFNTAVPAATPASAVTSGP